MYFKTLKWWRTTKRKEGKVIETVCTWAQPLWTLVMSSSQSLVRPSISLSCRGRNKIQLWSVELFWTFSELSNRWSEHVRSPSGPDSSPSTAPSVAPAADVLVGQIPPICTWSAPRQFLHLRWELKNVIVSHCRCCGLTEYTAESDFLTAEFSPRRGFSGSGSAAPPSWSWPGGPEHKL